MAVIDGTRAGTTGEGGESTFFAASTGNGDNLRPVDRVYPDFLDEGVEAETEGGDRCANKNKLEISQMFHAFCI